MTDISKLKNENPINNKYATCSALPTGFYSRLLVRKNYPVTLTIENIENKYDDRFDDVGYYGCYVDGGDVA